MEVQLAGRVPRASLPSDGWSQQLQELTQQNSDLLLQLDAKDGEIAVLEERLIALEPVAGGGGFGGPGSDPRDAKIIDLSKRNRALNMALEKKKSKMKGLKEELAKYKEIAESKVYPQRLRSSGDDDDEEESGLDEEKIKKAEAADAEAQIKMLQSRVEGLRVKLEKSQAELKATQRALVAEVGTDVPLATVVEEANKPTSTTGAGATHWKGRAQKIVVLKSKLKEASELIESLRERLGEEGGGSLQDGVSSVITKRTVGTMRTRLDVDASAKYELQEAAREKARALEKALDDLEAANLEIESERQKLEGAKARAKTLENENRKMKGHVRLLLAKATTDDQLIDAMRAEMKEGRERMLRDTHAAGSSAGGEHHSDGEARVLKQTIEQHSKQLSAQEAIITSLRAQIKTLRDKEREGGGVGGREREGGGGKEGSGIPRPSSFTRPRSSEIRAAAQQETDGVDATVKFLKADNARLTELVTSLQSRLQGVCSQQEEYIRRVSELEIKASDAGSGKGSKAAPPVPPTGKLKTLKEENDALRRTYGELMAAKDAEIQSLKTVIAGLKPA